MENSQMITYLRSVSDWRRSKAEQYPDDDRNERCADGLAELADHIESLPQEHEDIRVLQNACGIPNSAGADDDFIPGLRLEYDISHFRFYRAQEDVSQFLARMGTVAVVDRLEWAAEEGLIDVDDGR